MKNPLSQWTITNQSPLIRQTDGWWTDSWKVTGRPLRGGSALTPFLLDPEELEYEEPDEEFDEEYEEPAYDNENWNYDEFADNYGWFHPHLNGSRAVYWFPYTRSSHQNFLDNIPPVVAVSGFRVARSLK